MTNNMSFYGGRPGKSFVITKVFNTYEELQLDADKGWSSTIPVGDYVIIGYKYDGDIDLIQEKIYGGTLWQKVYNDKALNNNSDIYNESTKTIEINGRIHYFAHGEKAGVGYKFISETGNTPQLILEHEVLAPNVQPELETVFRNHGGAKYNFKLPRSSNYYYFDYILQKEQIIELINAYGNFNDEIIINDFTKFYSNNTIIAENLTYDNNIGDYFIEKHIGLVYKLEGDYNNLKLKLKTQLTVSPEADVFLLNYASGSELNSPKVELVTSQGTEGKLDSNYKFSLPKNPNINFNIDFISNSSPSVEKAIFNNDINYKINFPIGLKGISNFNIKYIVDTSIDLPIEQAHFADLGIVITSVSNTLWIFNGEIWKEIGNLENINFNTGYALDEITQYNDTETGDQATANYYNIKFMNDNLSWNGNGTEDVAPKFLSVKEGEYTPSPDASGLEGELYINTKTKEMYYEGYPLTVANGDNTRFELKVKASDWVSSGSGYYYIKYVINNFNSYFANNLISAPIITVNYETFVLEDGTLTDSRNMFSSIQNVSFTEEIKNGNNELTIYLKTFNTIYPTRDLVLQIWHLGETTIELIPTKSKE